MFDTRIRRARNHLQQLLAFSPFDVVGRIYPGTMQLENLRFYASALIHMARRQERRIGILIFIAGTAAASIALTAAIGSFPFAKNSIVLNVLFAGATLILFLLWAERLFRRTRQLTSICQQEGMQAIDLVSTPRKSRKDDIEKVTVIALSDVSVREYLALVQGERTITHGDIDAILDYHAVKTRQSSDMTSTEFRWLDTESVMCTAFHAAIDFSLTLNDVQATRFLRLWRDADWQSISVNYPHFDLDSVPAVGFVVANTRRTPQTFR